MPLPLASLTTPDVIVLVVCLVLAVRGAFKGFTWQVIRTAGLIGALWAATWLHEPVGKWLGERVSPLPEGMNEIAGWLLVVVGGWLLVTFVAHMARGVVRTADQTGTDRVLGFAMGALMGLTFTTIGFVVYGRVSPEATLEETLEDSHSARFMAHLIHIAEPALPASVCERFSDALDAIKAAADVLPQEDPASDDQADEQE